MCNFPKMIKTLPILLLLVLVNFSGAASADLLGVTPDFPKSEIVRSETVGLTYSAQSGQLSINFNPFVIFPDSTSFGLYSTSSTGSINITLDSAGALVNGGAGFELQGQIDIGADGSVEYDGVLLTGDVIAFGFQDGGPINAFFDFRVHVTGGLLAFMYDASKDLGFDLTAEQAPSFTGVFTQNFQSSFLKGVFGPIPQICFRMIKQISVDNGASWDDADNQGDPDVSTLLIGPDSDVRFRVIATNCGGVDLENVVLNDSLLNIVNQGVANIPIGSSITIDSGTLPVMDVDGICVNSGTIINSASVLAESAATNETVNGSDIAIVNCIGEPSLKLLKQISIDGGTTWFDADDVFSAPNALAPHGAEYQFIVENNGTLDLTNITLSDPTLGIAGFNIPLLTVGSTVTLNSGAIPEASVAQVCADPGSYPNTATVSASVDIQGVPTAVSDDDPAHLVCTGTPGISVLKEISVDGSTWADAKNAGDADVPETLFPSDAQYRFTVTNTGNLPLENVVIDDAVLGITGVDVYEIPTLAVAEVVVLTQGDIPKLFAANRCTNSGTFSNSVSVDADVVVPTGAPALPPVSDSDTSVLECVGEPGVKIVKEITVNGSDWFDANDAAGAPTGVTFPSDAEYRFTVSNIGSSALVNVLVTDLELGITDYLVGNLAVNESVVIGFADIAELRVVDRCTNSGTFTNIARVDGESFDNGEATTDDDPAVLVCIGEPNISLVKEISVDGGINWFDANASGDADVPTVVFPHDAEYRLTVRNTGTIALNNIVVNDATLGIIDVAVPGELAVQGEIILDAGDIPALAVADRCDGAGEVINVAEVSGQAVDTQNSVNASDPAVLNCVGTPHITLLKQISLDGTNWADADEVGDSDVPHVLAPSGAEYRFIVRNDGTSPLTGVTVNDADLGIVDYFVGDMAVGAEVIITSADEGALEVVTRCSMGGTFINVANVEGVSTETNETVIDSDPAVLVCFESGPGVCEVDVDLTATFGDTPPPVDCAECDGKITTLTLRYNGADAAFIVVTQKKDGATVFSDTVEPNSTFSFVGQDSKGTLTTEISVFVDGALDTKIHTSCSQVVLPGMTFGSFTVVAGESRNGGALCPLGGGTNPGCDDVTYTYTVTNTGDPVDVLLEDDTYDLGLDIFELAEGESQQFTNEVCVPTDTTNTASVTATVIGDPSIGCDDTASVTVYCSDQEVWVQHCTNSSSGGQQCSLVKETQRVCGDTPPPPACHYEYVWVQHCTNSSSGGQQCSLVKERVEVCDDTPPPAGCAECDGKVTNLTLQYNGAAAADITVTQKKDDVVVFSGNVAAGGEFSFTGQDDKGTLGTEIIVTVNGVEDVRIHTSCSDDIYPGLVFGSFTVIDGASLKGGAFCPMPINPPPPPPGCAECDGKVTNLTLQYNGAAAADITVTQKKDDVVVFSGNVAAGGEFSFTGQAKKGTLGTEIIVTVNGVEDVRIHTSCSVDIYPGLTFGSFTVIGGASRNGGEFCPLP